MVIRLVGGILAVLLALVVYSWALLAVLHVTGTPFECAILLAPLFYVVLLAGGILLIRSAQTDTAFAGQPRQGEKEVPCHAMPARQRWMPTAQRACGFVVGFILVYAGQFLIMLAIPHLISVLSVPSVDFIEISKAFTLGVFAGFIFMAIGTLLCGYSICRPGTTAESMNALPADLCSGTIVRRLSRLRPRKFLWFVFGLVSYWTGLTVSSLVLWGGESLGDLSLPVQLALVLITTMVTGTRLVWKALKPDC